MSTTRRRSAYATMAGSTASTVVAAAQSLVLLPLYLREVGPGLYGAWLATGEVLVWLLAFDFGIPNLLIQRVGALHAKGEEGAIGSHFATSMVSLLAISALLLSAVMAGAPYLTPVMGVSGAEASALTTSLGIGALSTSLMLLAYGFVGLSRGLQDTSLVQGVSLAGTIAGFALTAWLLIGGHGLVSIALGLLARSSFTLFGGVLFLLLRAPRSVRGSMRPTREAVKDIASHCPPMFAAGIGYALMNNSSVTIAAVMFRPEAAVVFGVTRKAADLARTVLDMIGHSSYAGFAHLYSQGNGLNVRSVYRELQSTFFLVSTSLLAAYVAVNPAFVRNWVGAEMYGGFALTLALALATVAGSWSYFQIGLYRSMGHHGAASKALLAECGARLALMVGLGLAFGVVGLAVGSVVTAVVSGVWASRRIGVLIGSSRDGAWVWRALPFVGAAVIGFFGAGGGWGLVVGIGALVCAAAFGILVATDPALHDYRRKFLGGQA
jgi:O-antigen/teichoic acid export membrane protein